MPLFGPPNVTKLITKRDVRGLIKALGHKKDAYVRGEAAKGLGILGDMQAIEPLLAALNDEDDIGVDHRIKRALGKIGRTLAPVDKVSAVRLLMVPAFHDSYDSDKDEARKELIKIGAPAVEAVIDVLRPDRPYSKKYKSDAVDVLGEIGDTRATASLLAILVDERGDRQENASLFYSAAHALGKIKDSSAVEPLCAALKHQNSIEIRECAALALGLIGDPRAIKPLIAACKDEDEDVRRTVIEALEGFKGSAVQPLDEVARDKEEDVWIRRRAVNALGETDDRRAVWPLIAHLEDEEMLLREAAAEGLEKLGDNRAIGPLVAALTDREHRVKRAAAQALKVLGWQPEDKSQKAQWAILQEDWRQLKELGKPAIGPLVGFLNTQIRPGSGLAPSGWVETIKVLGEIGDPSVMDTLIAAFNMRPGVEVAWAIESVLKRSIKDVPAASLQSISELQNVTVEEPTGAFTHDSLTDSTEPVYKTRVVYDCTQIRDIAKNELQRRRQ